jgi:3-deoxy-D-manno-octulosonate 8-phosphate phosphatase (KDO 8-P phosphatase)
MVAVNEKAKAVRLLVLDVDGVLTSGVIYYSNDDQIQFKGFHVHDGLGIKLLQKAGIHVAVISAKKSQSVSRRLSDLGVEHVYLGYEDKLAPFEELKKKLGLTDKDIAYMGDDLPDLPLLRRVNLAITVPQAPEIIKKHVSFVTANKAGKGAVREVCELILEAQDQYQRVIESYLTK